MAFHSTSARVRTAFAATDDAGTAGASAEGVSYAGFTYLTAGQGSRYGLVATIVLMILVTVLVVEGLAMWMRRVFR